MFFRQKRESLLEHCVYVLERNKLASFSNSAKEHMIQLEKGFRAVELQKQELLAIMHLKYAQIKDQIEE